MSSLSNQAVNVKSMNGLNDITVDSIDSSEIDTDIIRTGIIYSNFARGNFNFDQQLPVSNITPFNNNDLVTKIYCDNNFVDLSNNETINGIKTFNSLPLCSTLATTTNQLTNKQYVDNAISGAGTGYVTLTTAQTVTGNKDFTGTTRLGDALSADQPCKTSIMNNTTIDSSVKGSIGGESLYHQYRTGGRGFYQSQGATNSGRQYFSISGSGAPDPDVVMVMTENGVKIQNANVGDTSDYTQALYVVGTSKFTGIATFDVPPVSSVNPTTALQVCNKQYTDASNGPSILPLNNSFTGNNTFTGNNIFNPSTGTTTIRGNQVDIFPTITFLTSPTTSIAGNILNGNSTENWFNGNYTNLNGAIQTTMRSPTTLITGATCQYFTNGASIQTAFSSPSFLITNACTSFDVRATNTYLENSVVTATTQLLTDNSNKIATTGFCVGYGNSQYMTIGTNQTIPATTIKTFQGRQIFNDGITSNNIYASGIVDTNFCSNMGNGILTLGNNKIVCDTFGVRMINLNTQLNEGCFIQANPSLAVAESPSINFPNNAVSNFANTGNAGEADATKQINIGVLKFWCGNNQSSVFSITHSLTNGYAIGPAAWQEKVLTIQFVDANTGNVKWTSSNLADTALFSMPSLATVIRPTITFTLDTTTLPQAVYNIFAYVRIQNAFGSNVLNTMTWNLSASPSTLTTTQNYNTYKDYTFTSRNLYHCFRNTAMCGVYIINNIASHQNIMTPIHYSINDFTNFTSQPSTSGAVSTPAVTGGSAVGNFHFLQINNSDNIYLIYPNYSLILYDLVNYGGTILINYKNTTLNPVVVEPTLTQRGSSCKIYFDEVELIKY